MIGLVVVVVIGAVVGQPFDMDVGTTVWMMKINPLLSYHHVLIIRQNINILNG